MSTSVLDTPSIDFLWRDGFWKQVSGFSLLGAIGLAFLLPLRSRSKRLQRLSVRSTRVIHTVVGLGTLLLAGVHTGLRLGANLNAALMGVMIALLGIGAIAAVATSLEHRLPPRIGTSVRTGWRQAHVALVWPLPLLVLFHVLAVYFY